MQKTGQQQWGFPNTNSLVLNQRASWPVESISHDVRLYVRILYWLIHVINSQTLENCCLENCSNERESYKKNNLKKNSELWASMRVRKCNKGTPSLVALSKFNYEIFISRKSSWQKAAFLWTFSTSGKWQVQQVKVTLYYISWLATSNKLRIAFRKLLS